MRLAVMSYLHWTMSIRPGWLCCSLSWRVGCSSQMIRLKSETFGRKFSVRAAKSLRFCPMFWEDPQLMLGVVCSSFQCLRISNFFNNTDMNQIQAMALIGHCLRNNLDTNSAWILMGRCFVTRGTPIIMVANHKSRRYYAPCTKYRTPRREFLSRILSRPLPPQKTLVYPHLYQPLSTLLQTFES